MTYKTRGIILKAIKYGETSLVVTAMTELFGIQTYMVNGVRTSKRAGAKAILYQPAAILEMEVYHNDQKAMQRIKEATWAVIYQQVLTDVIKNSIALYMVELLNKILRQPEQQTDLYYFCEDCLVQLDGVSPQVAANFPLYFTLQLSHFFGFRISNPVSPGKDEDIGFLDLAEGYFTKQQPAHQNFLEGENALITAELLKVMQPAELEQLPMNHIKRRELLQHYLQYYALHIQDFGQMRTLQVMYEVLG